MKKKKSSNDCKSWRYGSPKKNIYPYMVSSLLYTNIFKIKNRIKWMKLNIELENENRFIRMQKTLRYISTVFVDAHVNDKNPV